MERSETKPAGRLHSMNSSAQEALTGWGSDANRTSPVGLSKMSVSEIPRTLGFGDDSGSSHEEIPGQSGPDGGFDDDSFSVGHSSDLAEAIRQAERLTSLLRNLEERERAAFRLDPDTMERIQRLEQSAQSIAAVHRALAEHVRSQVDDADLLMLENLLRAWVDRPNDLLVMVKLAERSSALATVVAAFREIRSLLAGTDHDVEARE